MNENPHIARNPHGHANADPSHANIKEKPPEQKRLRELCWAYAGELRYHPVLSRYWDRLSLIQKGSAARGYVDAYADIDLVVFTDEESYQEILKEYFRLGLSSRRDGLCLPLGKGDGHYQLDTYERLREYFMQDDLAQAWEYSNVRIVYDAQETFADIVSRCAAALPGRMDHLIREQYLHLRAQFSYMYRPLQRGDQSAALLYAAEFWRSCCRLLFLVYRQPYPCDKWLLHYLRKLPAPAPLKEKIQNYEAAFSSLPLLAKEQNPDDLPLYVQGKEIARDLEDMMHRHYRDQDWPEKWDFYI